MKRCRKYFFLISFLLLAGLAYPTKINAQLVDPGCDPLDPACPIDGGLSVLIAAAIGITARRSYKINSRN